MPPDQTLPQLYRCNGRSVLYAIVMLCGKTGRGTSYNGDIVKYTEQNCYIIGTYKNSAILSLPTYPFPPLAHAHTHTHDVASESFRNLHIV